MLIKQANEVKKAIKKKQNFFLIKQHVILTFIISLLGLLPACHHSEYGVPTAEFILNGKVKSTNTNQPIENIRVSTDENYNNPIVFTNSEGYFSIHFNGDAYTKNYTYQFQDTDSLQNGNYKNIDTIISFEDVPLTGSNGKWDKGTAEKTADIMLEPK